MMNERIRELALEAGAQGIVNRDFIDIEKFAQLIVRECADIATINQHEWHSAGSYVLKHFGFEQ
jgi:hypothetical protein